MNGTDRRISELEQKLAEVDDLDIKASAEIKDHFEKLLAENPPEPKPERELPAFDQWSWGDPPDVEDYWKKASIAAAELVIEQILDDGARVKLKETPDGDLVIEVKLGPFDFKIKRSDMEEITKAEDMFTDDDDIDDEGKLIGRHWEKDIPDNDIETWEWIF